LPQKKETSLTRKQNGKEDGGYGQNNSKMNGEDKKQ
jgi:hypothetical protein